MSKITLAEAQGNIARYKAENTHIKAPNGQQLNGFFLDRAEIEALLSTDATGIQLHLAKKPGAAEQEVTLVLSAVKPAISASAISTDAVTQGDVYGDPPPCPTVCNPL